MGQECVDALRASIYPFTATFAPQPPLTRPLEATTPRTSPSRAIGTLAKLTSVTEITALLIREVGSSLHIPIEGRDILPLGSVGLPCSGESQSKTGDDC